MFKSKLAFAAIGMAAACLPVHAQQPYPSGPVHLVLTSPAGGSADLMARVVAQQLSEDWKQPVVVENRAGAGGAIGMEYVARQPPDGLTFVISNLGPVAVTPLLSKTRYDTDKDFAPVSLIGLAPSVMVVNAASPYKTLADFVAAARANPDKMNFGTGGPGSLSRLGAEILAREAGIKMMHVPYNGGIASINALLGEQISMVVADIQPATPQIKFGKLRALAVTSPERSPLLPDVPTFAESGFAGVLALNSWAAYLPVATPPAIVEKLNAALRKALADPELGKKFAEFGVQPHPSSPAELQSFMAAEKAKYGKVIAALGLQRE